MSASLGEAVLDLTADNQELKNSLNDARDVVTQALGSIGDIAQGALTVGLGVATAAVGALGAGLGLAVSEAMDAQVGMAQLDAVLRSTGAAAAKQAEEWAAAQGKVVTSTALSNDRLAELSDKLTWAKAKLNDMQASWDKAKDHTETAALSLQKARDTVADLESQIASGSQTITTKLTDALGLTQPVVRMTRDELLNLADSLQQITPVSADAVVAGESMLLTFTQIGKDVFPDTTKTLLDMATAMNSGMTPSAEQLKSTAIQLGKALNDPKAGLTALTKVGVTFNDAQKKMIEQMVAAGDVAGAQKLILKELQTEFGGSAEAAGKTFSGQLQILKNRLLDVAEGIGMKLLPYFQDFLQNTIMPAIPLLETLGKSFADAFGMIMDGGGNIFEALLTGIANIFYTLGNVNPLFNTLAGWFIDLSSLAGKLGNAFAEFGGIGGVFGSLARTIQAGNIEGIFETILGVIMDLMSLFGASDSQISRFVSVFWQVYDVVSRVIGFISSNVSTILPFLAGFVGAIGVLGGLVPIVSAIGAVIAFLVSPIGLLAVAIGLLAAAWVNNWGGMRDMLIGFWTTTLQPMLADLWNWLQVNIPIALQILSDFWTNTLLPAITAVWAWLTTSLIPLLGQLWAILADGAAQTIPQLVAYWNNVLLPALTLFWAWVQANLLPLLGQLWTWLATNLPIAVQTVVTFWNAVLLPAFTGFYGWVFANLIPMFQNLWTWLQVNVPLAIQALVNFWNLVLLPALTNFWTWVTTVLFPLLVQWQTWLQTNIPVAIKTLTDIWNLVLLPALLAVWQWMNDVLFPFFQALELFWSAVFNKTIEAAAGLWQKVLLPAFTAVYNFVTVSLKPVLDTLITIFTSMLKVIGDIGTYITNTFEPIINRLVSGALAAWKGAVDGISGAIGAATAGLASLASAIANLSLPSWLTPGSPTPFEYGLRGIANALDEVNMRLPDLNSNLNINPGGAGALASVSTVTNSTTNINLSANYQNQTLTSLGDAVRMLSLARSQ